MSSAKRNFVADHYEWLVAAAGILLAAGAAVAFAASLGTSPEGARARCERELRSNTAAHTEVAPANMKPLVKALGAMSEPDLLKVPDEAEGAGSFLASEKRVFCQNKDCRRPIPAKCAECPFCKVSQKFKDPVDTTRVGDDADKDGIPDAWELKYGFDPRDPADAQKDPDGDTFTNKEEYDAKTDPKDPESHPDYLDFLSVSGELKKELLPFWFKGANKIPSGYRLSFEVTDKTYRATATAIEGVEIVYRLAKPKYVKGRMQDDKVKSGWRVVKYNEGKKRVTMRGASQEVAVDNSTAELENVKDKRRLIIRVNNRSVVDREQVDLQWSREGGKTITVSAGTEFKLGNREYKVTNLAKTDKGCKVTLEDLKSGKEKTLQ